MENRPIISLEKINNVYMRVRADASTRMEMMEYFSHYAPNFKFHPRFKAKIWNGKIGLFHLNDSSIYTGLLEDVLKFADEYGYDVQGTEQFIQKRDVERTKKIIQQIKSIPIIDKIELRDYQLAAIASCIENERQTVISPTGSGKSLIIHLLCQWHLKYNEPEYPILIIVPTLSLISQMKNDFLEYNPRIDPESIHTIFAGQDKRFGLKTKIIVSTWQSLHSIIKEERGISYFNLFEMVIVDECHNAKSSSLIGIMEKCVNAQYRIGMTGSLPKETLSQLTIKGLFGKFFQTTSTYDLQKKNLLADLSIKCIKLNYDAKEREIVKKLSYPDEIKYLVANERRNEFIASLAWGQLGNCLLLFNTIKHGKRLYEILKEKNKEGKRKVFLIYGGVGADEREQIRKIVTTEKNAILVASYGTLSTGVNIPSISSMIFSIGSKSSIRVIQSIGRGLRISPDGKSTVLYDIIDDLSYKSRENFALRHATERVSIYIKERFNFKVTELEFTNNNKEQ